MKAVNSLLGLIVAVTLAVVQPVNESVVINYNSESSVESEVAESCRQALNLVDDKVIESFIKSGWEVHIANEESIDEYGIKYSVLGLTDVKKRIIIISGFSGNDRSETMLHEIGHYIDSTYSLYNDVDYWSQTVEFMVIMNEEQENTTYTTKELRERYNIQYTPHEYFAESVSVYFSNSDRLKEEAPRTYEFIENIIENYMVNDEVVV